MFSAKALLHGPGHQDPVRTVRQPLRFRGVRRAADRSRVAGSQRRHCSHRRTQSHVGSTRLRLPERQRLRQPRAPMQEPSQPYRCAGAVWHHPHRHPLPAREDLARHPERDRLLLGSRLGCESSAQPWASRFWSTVFPIQDCFGPDRDGLKPHR